MTSSAYADDLHDKITDDTTHEMSYYEPEFYMNENHGTSHLSVIAKDGSAVAATSTVNRYLGSKVMSNSTGIILNNEMDDFSSPLITNSFGIPPSPNNFIRPGKRPMSSMCPTIIFDKNNKVKMVVGGSGGTKITTSVAQVRQMQSHELIDMHFLLFGFSSFVALQVILNALFFNYDLEKSVSDPRVHNQLSPNTTVAEPGFDIVSLLTSTGAVIQAVLRHGDWLYAQSDPRKWAYAAGY
uniref:Gamma-glutamyltransferase 1b n=1 Tax=Acanthochromis polyacanthus TaxID=80966 RepID=A0A3Q1G5L2_9TELE